MSLAREVLSGTLKTVDSGDAVAHGLALRTLAWQAKWRGDFDSALRKGRAAAALLTGPNTAAARGDLQSIMAVVHYSRLRHDLAASAVERGLAMIDGTSRAEVEARVDLLVTRATVMWYLGQPARATVTLVTATHLVEGEARARVEHNVARFFAGAGEHATALPYANRALGYCEEDGNRVVLPYALEVLGVCEAATGSTKAAATRFAQGLEVARADQDLRAECQLLQKQGRLFRGRGEYTRAADCLKRGETIAQSLGYPLWQIALARDLAGTCELSGDLEGALGAHNRAWKLEERRRA